MLASGAELGVNRDAAGILEIERRTRRAHSRLQARRHHRDRQQVDHAPARICGATYGMAREVAAILRKPLARPGEARISIPAGPPRSRSPSRTSPSARGTARWCSRTSRCGPSPLWLQYRLEAIGLNPINNIVDVTNFIMSELAQPMHAFDRNLLHGGHHLHPARARRREGPGAERGEVRSRRDQPGDRGCQGADRARRRDRRHGQRHPRTHPPHRARKRLLSGFQHAQDLGEAEAAHRRFDAIRKGAGSRTTRCAALARAVELFA